MAKHRVRTAAAFGAFLLLTACAGHADRSIDAFFLCGKDVVHARFTGDRLKLTKGVTEYRLDQARSGSGARYTGDSPDGPVEFWNKGRTARLTIGGRAFPECHQQGSAH